jgi:GxxExxY protein
MMTLFCSLSMFLRVTLTNEGSGKLSKSIIGLCIEVHRHLGPGLLESSYEQCLSWELEEAGIAYQRQPLLPIKYKDHELLDAYRPDLIVSEALIVEIKCVDKLIGVHRAQLATYMKHTGIRVGLLFNFNTEVLREGIKRLVM